jgi:hypothetical protein
MRAHKEKQNYNRKWKRTEEEPEINNIGDIRNEDYLQVSASE